MPVIAFIDTATSTVTSTVQVDNIQPGPSATSPDGLYLYVPNHNMTQGGTGDNVVDVIDLATKKLIDSIPVEANPHWVVFGKNGLFYVTDHMSAVVTVLNANTNHIIKTIDVGETPHSEALSPDGSRLAVTSYNGDAVFLINTVTDQMIKQIPVGKKPLDVALLARWALPLHGKQLGQHGHGDRHCGLPRRRRDPDRECSNEHLGAAQRAPGVRHRRERRHHRNPEPSEVRRRAAIRHDADHGPRPRRIEIHRACAGMRGKAAMIELALGRDGATASPGTDARRVLQLLLAATWLMDGMLQYQSFMYTKAFGQMIGGTAAGNPGIIARPISWNAALVTHHLAAEHGLRHHSAAAGAGNCLPSHGPAGAGRLDRVVAGCVVVRRRPRRCAEWRREPGERRSRRGDLVRAASCAAVAGPPAGRDCPVRGVPGGRGTSGPAAVAGAVGQPGLLRADPGEPGAAGAARHYRRA